MDGPGSARKEFSGASDVVFMVTCVKTFPDGAPDPIGYPSVNETRTIRNVRTEPSDRKNHDERPIPRPWIHPIRDVAKFACVSETIPVRETVRQYVANRRARDVLSVYGRVRMKGLQPQFKTAFDPAQDKMIKVKTGARVITQVQREIDAHDSSASRAQDAQDTNEHRIRSLCESLIIGRTLSGKSVCIRVSDSMSATYRIENDTTYQIAAVCTGNRGQLAYLSKLCNSMEQAIEFVLSRRSDMRCWYGFSDPRDRAKGTFRRLGVWKKVFQKDSSIRQPKHLDRYPHITSILSTKHPSIGDVEICRLRFFWSFSASDYQWVPIYHTCTKKIRPIVSTVHTTLKDFAQRWQVRNQTQDVSTIVLIIQEYISPVERRPEVFFQIETRISSVIRAVRSMVWDYDTECPKNPIRFQDLRADHGNGRYARRPWVNLQFTCAPCAKEVTGSRRLIQRYIDGAGDIVRFDVKGSQCIDPANLEERRTSYDMEYDSTQPEFGWNSIFPANRPTDPPASEFGAVACAYDLEVVTPAPAFPKSEQMCNMIVTVGLHRGFQVGRSGVHEVGAKGELPTDSVILSLSSVHSEKASRNTILSRRNVSWRHYVDEMSLLNAMREQLLVWSPDILSGYNSHIFDDRYAVERSALLNALAASPRTFPRPPSKTPWFVFITVSNPGLIFERYDEEKQLWIPLPSYRMTDVLVGAGGPAQGLAFHPLSEGRFGSKGSNVQSSSDSKKRTVAFAYRVVRSSARSFYISNYDSFAPDSTSRSRQTVKDSARSNTVKHCEFQCIARPMDPVGSTGWSDTDNTNDFRLRISFDVKSGGFPTLQVTRILAGLFKFRAVQLSRYLAQKHDNDPKTFPHTDLSDTASELETHVSVSGCEYVQSVFHQVVADFGSAVPSVRRSLFMYLTPVFRYPATYRIREIRSDKRSSTSIYFIDPRDMFTNIDVMAHIKKTYRLPSYSLKFVCKNFLSELEKYEMDIPTLFDIAYGTRLFHPRLQMDLTKSVGSDIRERVNRGEEVIPLSTRDDGFAAISLYCAIDAARVLELMHALQVGDNTKIMSKVAGFRSFNDTTLGQMQKLGFMLYKFSTTQFGAVMDTPRYKCIDAVNRGLTYTGATVCEPIKGAHDWVVCLDFASLYPSIMMGERMSPDLLLNKPLRETMSRELNQAANRLFADSSSAIESVETNTYIRRLGESCGRHSNHRSSRGGLTRMFKWIDASKQVHEDSTHAAFVQTDPGIIPSLERKLLQLRTQFKKNMKRAKSEADAVMASYWNRMQLVVKILMNSLYGFLGNGSSPQNKMGVAGSVCAHARQLLALAVREASVRGWDLYYGDTDSIFVQKRVPVDVSPPTPAEKSMNVEFGRLLRRVGLPSTSMGLSVEGVSRAMSVGGLGDLSDDDAKTVQKLVQDRNLESARRSLVPNYTASVRLEHELNRFYAHHEAITNKLECEKLFRPVFLLAKKKYCGFSYETSDPSKGKFYTSGLSSNKRDLPPFLRSLTTDVFKCICVKGDRNGAITVLSRHLVSLLNGSVPIVDIAVCKKLKSRAFQKGPKPIHEIVNDRLAESDPGRRKKPGEYIRYGFRARPPHISAAVWKRKKSLAAISIDDIRVVDLTVTVLDRLYKFGVKGEQSRGDLREVSHMFSENNPFPLPIYVPKPEEKIMHALKQWGVPFQVPGASSQFPGDVFYKLPGYICIDSSAWPSNLRLVDGTQNFIQWRNHVRFFLIRFDDLFDSTGIEVLATLSGYYESHSGHSLVWSTQSTRLPEYLRGQTPDQLHSRKIASVPFGTAVDTLLLRTEYAATRISFDQVPYNELSESKNAKYSDLLGNHTQSHIQSRVDRFLSGLKTKRKRKVRD